MKFTFVIFLNLLVWVAFGRRLSVSQSISSLGMSWTILKNSGTNELFRIVQYLRTLEKPKWLVRDKDFCNLFFLIVYFTNYLTYCLHHTLVHYLYFLIKILFIIYLFSYSSYFLCVKSLLPQLYTVDVCFVLRSSNIFSRYSVRNIFLINNS